MLEIWHYAIRNPDLIAGWVTAHVILSFAAAAIGTILGISTGIYVSGSRHKGLADIVLYLAEIMMTVPSLALFGLLMLLLSAIGLPAIGFLPAIIALILYGQLPILQNTYAAIRGVDPSLIEAGRGMGMTGRQLLLRIKLPLAVPIIMAGLRNAIVLVIGIAAIAALIGSGGLGVPIFSGLTNARIDKIVIGGVGVSILALAADGLMSGLQRWATPKGLRGKR